MQNHHTSSTPNHHKFHPTSLYTPIHHNFHYAEGQNITSIQSVTGPNKLQAYRILELQNSRGRRTSSWPCTVPHPASSPRWPSLRSTGRNQWNYQIPENPGLPDLAAKRDPDWNAAIVIFGVTDTP